MSSDVPPAVVAAWQRPLPGCPACCPPYSPAHGASRWPPRQVLTPALSEPPQLLPPCSQEYGGSEIRPEATGYGAVLFVENVLKDKGESLKVRPASAGMGNMVPASAAQCGAAAAQATAHALPHPRPRPASTPWPTRRASAAWCLAPATWPSSARSCCWRRAPSCCHCPTPRATCTRCAGQLRLVGCEVWTKPECGCCRATLRTPSPTAS